MKHAVLDTAGFLRVQDAVSALERTRLLEVVQPAISVSSVVHRSGSAFAARGLLLAVPTLRNELGLAGIDALASDALGQRAIAIDALFIDKHAAANWTVPGHQDRIMPATPESRGPVRVRDGVPYAEPSAAALSQLIACRVHFDATDSDSGALCFVAGSHRSGVLSTDQIRAIPRERYEPCPATAGDVLLMRPLILHRSSPSTTFGHRRVLHIVYAPEANATDPSEQ